MHFIQVVGHFVHYEEKNQAVSIELNKFALAG